MGTENGNRKTTSILDFVDKNSVNASNSVFPEREMTVNDAIIAIGKGLWYKYRNADGKSGYIEFTLTEILDYGGYHGRDLTVGIVNNARNVLNTLAKYRYLEKIPAIVSLYAITEKSELWKILGRAKSPVDIIAFIREVVNHG